MACYGRYNWYYSTIYNKIYIRYKGLKKYVTHLYTYTLSSINSNFFKVILRLKSEYIFILTLRTVNFPHLLDNECPFLAPQQILRQSTVMKYVCISDNVFKILYYLYFTNKLFNHDIMKIPFNYFFSSCWNSCWSRRSNALYFFVELCKQFAKIFCNTIFSILNTII